MFRFTIRDVLWLITGIAIAFAILGSLQRREYATWNKERAMLREERAALQGVAEQQKARATSAERNLKGIYQDLQNPAVIEELVLAREAEQKLRSQNRLRPTNEPNP
jgi:hypothetical protein